MRWPENCDFICLLEWDEKLYLEALSWALEGRWVAIVSEKARGSAHPRVKIYHCQTIFDWPTIARKIAWSAVMKKMYIVGEGALKEEIVRCHMAADLILSEAADSWMLPMLNGKANEFPYRRGIGLKGAFSGVPAIIVGAGPSLEKNGHLLKEFEKKALIFAGGTALNLIETEPHFGGALDAENRLQGHPFSKVPFCYQSRMHRENRHLIEGEKLLFPDGSCEALNWIYEEEPFQAGWTVGNFLTAVALHFGCTPIYFVGMDLSYEKGKKYAWNDKEDATFLPRDWAMAAQWLEEMAKGRELINATEGGILRLKEAKLVDVLKRSTREWDLRKWVHDTIEKQPIVSAAHRWKKWEESLRGGEQIVYEKLLLPLWEIWRPVFEREEGDLRLHQHLFFERVLQEHAETIFL